MSFVPASSRSVQGPLCLPEAQTQNKDYSNHMGKVEARAIFRAWQQVLERI
jgi:hypothetical protein